MPKSEEPREVAISNHIPKEQHKDYHRLQFIKELQNICDISKENANNAYHAMGSNQKLARPKYLAEFVKKRWKC